MKKIGRRRFLANQTDDAPPVSSFEDTYKRYKEGNDLSWNMINDKREKEWLDMTWPTEKVKGNSFLFWLIMVHPEEVSAFVNTWHANIDFNIQNEQGWTALMLATRCTSKDIVKILVDAGANLDLQNDKGWTALMVAVRHSSGTANKEIDEGIVKLLIDAGANVDLQTEKEWTALMIAARDSGNDSTEGTVQLLLDAGANRDLQNEDGFTALMFAARNSGEDSTEGAVKLLLDAGANVDIQNEDGWTALMFSCYNSGEDSTEGTVQLLLDAGANVDLQNKNGTTALMFSCYSTEGTVQLLLDAGANVDLQNKYGTTALMLAARNIVKERGADTIQLLIDAGANANLQNEDGHTVYDFLSDYTTWCAVLQSQDYQCPKEVMDRPISTTVREVVNVMIAHDFAPGGIAMEKTRKHFTAAVCKHEPENLLNLEKGKANESMP